MVLRRSNLPSSLLPFANGGEPSWSIIRAIKRTSSGLRSAGVKRGHAQSIARRCEGPSPRVVQARLHASKRVSHVFAVGVNRVFM